MISKSGTRKPGAFVGANIDNGFLSINGNRLINNYFSYFDVLLLESIEIDNKTLT